MKLTRNVLGKVSFHWLKRIQFRWWLVIFAFIVFGFSFYWIQIRPELIRRGCYKRATEFIMTTARQTNLVEIRESIATNCIIEKGIRP